MCDILSKSKEHFLGVSKDRMKYTLVPLVFKALKLSQAISNSDQMDTTKNVFKFVRETVTFIKESNPEISFKLLIECALASGRTGIGKLSFHFLTKTIEVFEEKFVKEKEKFDALKLIMGALNSINSIPLDDYTKLVTKIVSHCNNMVNIEYKIRLIAMSCNLFHAETADGLYDNKEDLVKNLKLSVSAVTKGEEFEKKFERVCFS